MKSIFLIQTRAGYWDFIQGRGLPLPVLHASSLVEKKYDVRIIELRTILSWTSYLRALILEKKPFLIGITVMIGPQIHQAIKISRMAKSLLKDKVKIVWGGVFPSLNPDLVLSEKSVDYVVFGEGEETLLRLADTLCNSGSVSGTSNVFYRDDDGLVSMTPTDRFLNLNDLPLLPYHLIKRERNSGGYGRRRVVSIETSRGCPNTCSFCYNAGICKGHWRAKRPERVFEELKQIKLLFNPQNIFIIDDNFFLDTTRALRIGECLSRLTMPWGTHGLTPEGASELDDFSLKKLVDLGCRELKIGIENVSPRFMTSMNKIFDTEKLRDFNARLSRHNIGVQYSFIFGFPGESMDDIKTNIDFIFRLRKENRRARIFLVTILFPFPGTEVYRKNINEPWKKAWNLERYGEFEINTAGGPWLNRDRLDLLKSLTFTSMFLSRKELVYSNHISRIFELARKIYWPFARYRFKNMFFKFPVDVRIGNKIMESIYKCMK